MKRVTLGVLLALLWVCADAQTLTFGREIEDSADSSVVRIRRLWREYFEACRDLPTEKMDSLLSVYWNDTIAADVVGSSLSATFPLYKMGNHHTFSIRKVDDSVSEINTLLRLGDGDDVFCIYKICFANGKFKNYFTFISDNLQKVRTGNITYYLPYNVAFNREQADEVERFIEKFAKNYDIAQISPIRYVIGNSIDECQSFLGFPYTVARSEKKYAGMAVHPDIIISCRQNHIHEIVHRLMRANQSGGLSMLHEGIATYYGGTGDLTMQEHVDILRKYADDKTELNFADFDSYNEILDGGSNPYYTVGFLLVDRAMKMGGEGNVKKLFEYASMDDMFEHEFNIGHHGIDKFIREIIKKYIQ